MMIYKECHRATPIKGISFKAPTCQVTMENVLPGLSSQPEAVNLNQNLEYDEAIPKVTTSELENDV